MRGQAFAQFKSEASPHLLLTARINCPLADVSTASQALNEANGYMVKDQPLVIAYSHHTTS